MDFLCLYAQNGSRPGVPSVGVHDHLRLVNNRNIIDLFRIHHFYSGGNDPAVFLKPDEFDKTAIDYALEAGNYPFLKYLMEKEYIWFTKKDESGDCVGFCAGTSIKFDFRERTDYLDCRLGRDDDLRLKLISLALKNEDFEVLDALHAREIPLLYTISYSSCQIASPDSFLNMPNSFKQLIRDIAQSKRNVIAYFFKEFEIKTRQDSINTFIFPYTGEILDVLIEKKRLSQNLHRCIRQHICRGCN